MAVYEDCDDNFAFLRLSPEIALDTFVGTMMTLLLSLSLVESILDLEVVLDELLFVDNVLPKDVFSQMLERKETILDFLPNRLLYKCLVLM